MSTALNPTQERVYPIPAPATDRRFTLGLVFAVVQVLVDHGFPRIQSGGDLVALRQALYGFLYAPPAVRDDGGFSEAFLERQQQERRRRAEQASTIVDTDGPEILVREGLAAIASLWDRRDSLTPVELAAIRAITQDAAR